MVATPSSADAIPFPVDPQAGVVSEHACGKTNEFNRSYVMTPQGPDRRATDREADDMGMDAADRAAGFFSKISAKDGIFAALFMVLFLGCAVYVVWIHPQWVADSHAAIKEIQIQASATNEKAWTAVKEIQKDAAAIAKEVATTTREALKENQNELRRELERAANTFAAAAEKIVTSNEKTAVSLEHKSQTTERLIEKLDELQRAKLKAP